MISGGLLPQPLRIGAGSSRIPESDVAAYLDRVKKERRSW
jgi:predicted DNA-binding transcriptional regulator AlpA